jgi:hypothetical protein
MYPDLESPERVLRCIGDDWVFKFKVMDHTQCPPVAANLNGYVPGGTLVIPNTTDSLAITGDMVDVTELTSGVFTFCIASTITNTYLPDNLAYHLQVYLIDPIHRKHTYLIIPLQIVAVYPRKV